MSKEISEIADIQFSVYHYKTGDMQLNKHDKGIKYQEKSLLCMPKSVFYRKLYKYWLGAGKI